MATNYSGYRICIEVNGKLIKSVNGTMFKDLAQKRMQDLVEECKANGMHGVAHIRSERSGRSCGHAEF